MFCCLVAAALVTLLYCCCSVRSRKRNRELEAGQARLTSKESYDSGSSDEANRLPAFFPGGKPKNGLAQIRTGRLGGKADPLRANSEVLSSSDTYSSTDYTNSNEKVLNNSGHVATTVASSDVASPGGASILVSTSCPMYFACLQVFCLQYKDLALHGRARWQSATT